MRVAFDGRELEDRPTGVGRVLDGLLSRWPADDEILLVCRQRPDVPLPDRVEIHVRPGPRWLPGSLWEQAVLPGRVRRLGADALVCPAYGMPLRSSCPTAVGMHDCAFASLPDTFRPRERTRRRINARIAARRGAFLFMGSEFSAREAERVLGVGRDRLLVLPYGVGPRFRPAPGEDLAAVRRRYELPRRPLLFVGSLLQRRRLPGLAAAVERIARERPGVELCLVGDRPGEEVESPFGAGARWLGYVPEEDLPPLYSAAAVVVYPSRYEGFGLPVMEALACGAAVITSRTGALAEVYRHRAVLVDPEDVGEWARAIVRLLDEPELLERCRRRGSDWARERDWGAPAEMLRARLAASVGAA